MKSTKKQIIVVFAILTMALVLSCALVACDKTDTPDAPKKEFTITFDTRGGSEVKPITIAEGATITLPRNPTKEGYIFDGWYLSDEFIEKFNATQTISSNITVYARWKEDGNQDEKQSYTITFDTQGGSEVKSITIAEGETITLPSNPTKEGYIFDGWYLSDEFIEKFNATQTISSNITVYAKWREGGGNQDEKQTYTVTFDTQGGSEVKSITIAEGETITLPSNPTKEGSVFDGWYLDSSYTQAFDSTKRIDSNIVLYAKWRILDDGQAIIASDYFDINGLVLTMNKKNYIESTEDVFDLRNKFSTSTGSSWRAFTSPNCDQPTEITTRMANVSVGWNDIYVMVENLTTYENQIYRLKIYKYPTIVYRELNDGFLEIQSVSDCADVLFPDDKINNITSIGKNAFSSCPSLRTLQKLPKLTSIGPSAFANCKRLTNIEIPDSVTSIGDSAFSGCSGLTSITIPNSVTSIGDSAFYGCTGLTSITVPENNSAYSSVDGILYDKNKTKIIHVPESIKGAITIPDSVTSIGEGTFRGCSSLESITIPFVGAKAGVTSSDTYQYPFGYIFGTSSYAGGVATKQYYYGNSTSSTTSTTYYIPSSLKSVTVTGGNILYGAFRNCTGLTSVTIGNSVTSIGDYAFDGCTGLTSVTIGGSVTSIGRDAFWGCTGLTSVTIPDSVTSIGEKAFYGCDKLIEVYNKSSLTITAGSSDNGYVAYYAKNVYKNAGENKLTEDENGYVIYTDGYKKILVAYTGTNTELILPSYITEIYQNAFRNCTGLTSITIGNSVTSIGNSAFRNCTGLTSITVPNRVKSIGDGAFKGCNNLTSMTLPFVGASVTAHSGYDEVFGYIFGYTTTTKESSTVSGATYQYYGNSKYYHYYIPSSITSVTITGRTIPYRAFRNCTGLTSVTIGNSVTSIGIYAFYNCTGLTSVTIGGSVTSIGDGAFEGCSDLTTVNWNATACTSAGSLYSPIFKDCSNLATVNIGDNVTTIPSYAFRGCKGLTSVTIGNGVTSIGESSFSGCGLTSVTIPNSVTSIGDGAFSGCSGLTSVTIGNGVTSIGYSVFSGCKGLTSITIPDSVTSIDYQAFEYCTGLMSITIGNGVTSIGNYAFHGCTGLTSIIIPDSVTSIGIWAFYDCSGLTSVTIGNGVTSIGYSAFSGCTGLTTVNWNATACTSAGSSDSPIFKDCSNLATVKIGVNVTTIPSYAFYGCSGLTSMIIPDSVTSIGKRAFGDCTGLTSVTIGNSVTSIGSSAFSGCSGLTSITIPDSVTSIGDFAFYNCTGLTTVNWNATKCTRAGSSDWRIFSGCSKLATINIGDNVTTIPSYAFSGCSGLTSITIPNGVTSIGENAFSGCNNLQNIYITDIEAWFNISGFNNLMMGSSDNKNLYINHELATSITIPNGVTEIPSYAFYGCSSLTSITIPDGVTSIGGSAFYGCSGLTSITIPNSVTSIGNWAFRGCTGLTSVTIPNSVTSIGNYAFFDCTGLTSITIGNGVTSIGDYAFYGCTSLTNIKFNGTIAQWNAISKVDNWKNNVPATEVVCTDGKVSI